MSRAQLTSTVEQNTGGAVSPYVAGKNAVINGGMDIWQRSTSSSTLGNYTTADRWYVGAYSGTGTFAQESTTVPSGSRYSLKFTASATSQPYAYQVIETANAQQFAGQTVTLSSKLAASTSTAIAVGLEYSTSTDAAVGGSWTGITPSAGGTATPTSTTFISGTATFAVPSTAKSLRVGFYTVSTIASAVVLYIGQVQLETGSIATPFSRAGGTLSGELAACQRYYFKLGGEIATQFSIRQGGYYDANYIGFYCPYPQPMRVAPSITAVGNPQVYQSGTPYSGFTWNNVISGNPSTQQQYIVGFKISHGLTVNLSAVLYLATTSDYIGVSAEL